LSLFALKDEEGKEGEERKGEERKTRIVFSAQLLGDGKARNGLVICKQNGLRSVLSTLAISETCTLPDGVGVV